MKTSITSLTILFLLFSWVTSFGQANRNQYYGKDSIQVFVNEGNYLLTPNNSIPCPNDTMILLPPGTRYKITTMDESSSGSATDLMFLKSDTSTFWGGIFGMVNDAVFIQDSAALISESGGYLESDETFLKYSGRKIGSIRLKKVDIIDGSVIDTLRQGNSDFVRFLNDWHTPTKDNVIMQNLLFDVGDTVSANTMADNERLLRDFSYIQDARIVLIPSLMDTNMVDVLVITKDVFPLGVEGSFNSFEDFSFGVVTKNFLGNGWEMRHKILYKKEKEPPVGYKGSLIFPNIWGSFFRSELAYETTWDLERAVARVERDFLTPDMRWAGGAGFQYNDVKNVQVLKSYNFAIDSTFIFNNQDFWLSRSFSVGEGDLRKNIRVGARMNRTRFTDRPEVSDSSNFFYHNGDLVLTNLSLVGLKYFKSSMIYEFGRIEDLPVGYIFELLGGALFSELSHKPYTGASIRGGTLIPGIGYMAGALEYGTFFEDGIPENGVFNVVIKYFTDLIKIGSFRNRNFIDIVTTTGINRNDSRVIFIDSNEDLHLFPADSIWGFSQYTINLESVFFTPWNFYGFKTAPFIFADFMKMQIDTRLNLDRDQYSVFGAGIRIKNEGLVFDTFQFRLSYIPITVKGTSDIRFKFSFESSDLFKSFLTGKPEIIQFR